jgi:hypothetical protein
LVTFRGTLTRGTNKAKTFGIACQTRGIPTGSGFGTEDLNQFARQFLCRRARSTCSDFMHAHKFAFTDVAFNATRHF